MLNKANNEDELIRILFPSLKNIVDYIMQKLWNENREIVRKIVYDTYKPKVYQRTNEFKESWDYEITSSKKVSRIQAEFYYSPNKMTSVFNGQHSSIFTGEVIKEYLADIIYQGLVGDFTGKYKYARQNPLFSNENWANSRNAWNLLLKKVGKTNMDKWFAEGAKYAGVSVKKS